MTVMKMIPFYHHQMHFQMKVFKTKHCKLHLQYLEDLIEYKLQYKRVHKLENSSCMVDIVTMSEFRKN